MPRRSTKVDGGGAQRAFRVSTLRSGAQVAARKTPPAKTRSTNSASAAFKIIHTARSQPDVAWHAEKAWTFSAAFRAFLRFNPNVRADMAYKFEIYKDKAGEFRFRFKAPNGENMFGSEDYKSKSSAVSAVESIQKNAAGAQVDDQAKQSPCFANPRQKRSSPAVVGDDFYPAAYRPISGAEPAPERRVAPAQEHFRVAAAFAAVAACRLLPHHRRYHSSAA
jgi:uncharacterized protein YegP (UPF0339 family)